MVSSLRRNSEVDEVRHRKRGYDESYVDWNHNIRQNLFAIREVMGAREFSGLEQDFENYLVDRLSKIDSLPDARLRYAHRRPGPYATA